MMMAWVGMSAIGTDLKIAMQIGLVGYLYDQISPDRGCAPMSRVMGIGPQLGFSQER
jgi:hypothetical protein